MKAVMVTAYKFSFFLL